MSKGEPEYYLQSYPFLPFNVCQEILSNSADVWLPILLHLKLYSQSRWVRFWMSTSHSVLWSIYRLDLSDVFLTVTIECVEDVCFKINVVVYSYTLVVNKNGFGIYSHYLYTYFLRNAVGVPQGSIFCPKMWNEASSKTKIYFNWYCFCHI